MKKLLTILAFALLAVPGQIFAEQINSFDVEYQVSQDSSVQVKEVINYDFGNLERHGIFRYIPYKYQRSSSDYNLRISDISVTDEAGKKINFTTSKASGDLDIKIGDADVTVTGTHTYNINYKVKRAINYFDDHDEFYWNVTGNGWTVPILSSSATVILPAGDNSKITNDCFAGIFGTTSRCTSQTRDNNKVFFSQSSLQPAEGLTIVIGTPKELLIQPTRADMIKEWIKDNYGALFPLLGIIGLFVWWYKKGRDPKPSIPMVAQYEAPDKLQPIEIGYLVDEQTQDREISAEIIFLATQGYLKIERIPKSGWFGKEDFKLIKVKPEENHLSAYDKNLLEKIFTLGGSEVLLNDLKKKGKLTRADFNISDIPKKLTAEGYYTKNPNTVRLTYILGGIIVAFVLAILLIVIFSPIALVFTGIFAVAAIAFGYFMPRKTPKGADAKQLILGLEEYLSVAEKDRLDFHNDPAKDPKIFEKLLPYAIALDVSTEWAKKFDGLFDYHPSWYSDPAFNTFSTIHLMSSLDSFNSGMVAVTNPQSGGSGGSGFGGGGFSGGGMGGGGGGSW